MTPEDLYDSVGFYGNALRGLAPPRRVRSRGSPAACRTLERGGKLQAELVASDDDREGLSAVVEKRKARFSNT